MGCQLEGTTGSWRQLKERGYLGLFALRGGGVEELVKNAAGDPVPKPLNLNRQGGPSNRNCIAPR